MEQCGEFPLRQVETPLSLAADYALTPVCFGTGFLGCAFIVLVLNRAEMRRDNATNVFLTALAVMDLLTLITSLPSALRQIEVFPLAVSYSYTYTLVSAIATCVHHVTKHSCYWLLAFALVINYSNQPDISKSRSPKWTRISASRLWAFLNVLFTTIIDIPSIVELRVIEVKDHCFAGMQLFSINRTAIVISKRIDVGGIFTTWYPNIQVISLIVCPLFLVIVFSLVTLLLTAAARGRMAKSTERPIVVAKRPVDQDERRAQQNAALVATSISFFLFRVPYHALIYYYSEWFAVRESGSVVSLVPYSFARVTTALYVIAIACQFLIYAMFNNDFTVAFKRMFCCLCKAGDKYVETPSCFACCSCCAETEPEIDFGIEKKRPPPTRECRPLISAPLPVDTPIYHTLDRRVRGHSGGSRRYYRDYTTLGDNGEGRRSTRRLVDGRQSTMRSRSLPRRPGPAWMDDHLRSRSSGRRSRRRIVVRDRSSPERMERRSFKERRSSLKHGAEIKLVEPGGTLRKRTGSLSTDISINERESLPAII